MNLLPFILLLLLSFTTTSAQTTSFADSIRIQYGIPELAYAVVSSDSLLEMQALGVQRVNTNLPAKLDDRFRIGSNTKTITAFIAALMVKEGHIQWDTQFFELYPELLRQSHPAYENMTLQDLLTMRVPLMKWSYGNNTPTKKEIKGNPQEQRYAFVAWILQQDPVAETSTVYWSNPAYVAAGLMLEKASGKSYETLVETFGLELGILFGFGQPNDAHKLQPWGHDNNLQAEPPGANYQLNWLSAAGNINVSLPGYTIFVQLQLRGLQGKFARFTAEEFDYLHYGLPECSFGWKWYVDESTQWKYSYHDGNPGTFLSKTVICKDTDKAFIIFTNVQSPEAEEGMKVLLEELKRRYNHV